MSYGLQAFLPRCGICKKERRAYNNLELVRTTPGGAYLKCLTCGRESYRQSRSVRRAWSPGEHEARFGALNNNPVRAGRVPGTGGAEE